MIRPEKGAALLESFIKAMDDLGSEEVMICSNALDFLRVHLGSDRACGVWKTTGNSSELVCERGVLPKTPVQNEKDFLSVPVKSHDDPGFGHLVLQANPKELADPTFVKSLELFARLLAVLVEVGQGRVARRDREERLTAEVKSTSRELESTNQKLIDRVKEMKSLYNELQNRVEELTRANRAKDEFLSIVSHELRTPLTSLSGFLAVLLDGEAGPLTEQQRKFVGIAKASAGRLNLIISDLLDISRIESGRLTLTMEDCSAIEIVKTSVDGLRSAAVAKNLQLTFEAGDSAPPIFADASRIQQVTDNLIANAIKFTDRGGQIHVRLDQKGDFIQISVEDTGMGLSPEEQSKVFDMFYQADASTRRPAGGAGLGLAIARGIVAMHGGQISVKSEKGKGSTFTFLIPHQRAQKAA